MRPTRNGHPFGPLTHARIAEAANELKMVSNSSHPRGKPNFWKQLLLGLPKMGKH